MGDFVDEIVHRFDAHQERRNEIHHALTELLSELGHRLNRRVNLELVDECELVWKIELPGVCTQVSSSDIDDSQRLPDGSGGRTSTRDKDVKTALKEVLRRKLRFTS